MCNALMSRACAGAVGLIAPGGGGDSCRRRRRNISGALAPPPPPPPTPCARVYVRSAGKRRGFFKLCVVRERHRAIESSIYVSLLAY